MNRVIVTGPTGSIGVALINKLITKNIKVLAVCHANSTRTDNIPDSPLVQIVKLDLNHIKELPDIVKERYDTFYHFGWDGTFGNTRNNIQGQLNNIQYTLDAVETANAMGCTTFIGAGSQAEYGRVEGKLYPNTPAFPENGYGMAKLAAGQMSRILCSQKGMRYIWTRILSVYGPYDGENTMIMYTIRTLLDKEIPELTKGEQLWDYIYSEDAGNAMYLLGESGKDGKVYCIGSGYEKQLSEYMYILRDCIDSGLKLGLGMRQYSENQVMHLVADISDLEKDTGFTVENDFETGIKKTIEWYKGQRKCKN